VHIATVTHKNPLELAPGEYVCEDVTAGQMLANGWASSVEGQEWYAGFDALGDWNDKRILFVRPGGFGDLLFLTPTIAEMKRRWPKAEIYVACFDRFFPALENNPDVSGLIQFPIALKEFESFDAQIWLEGIIEKNPDALRVHAVDLIAERCGIQLSGSQEARKMRYYVTKEEFSDALEAFPENSKRRIGVQMTASGVCRMYPNMGEVVKKLWMDGREVFLFGRPGEIKTEPDGIVNLMAKGKSFRESCAILMTCDVLVAPDSALTHVAGALNIPCVALYGPFPWTLRTAYAPKTFAIQGVGACAPCFHHALPGKGPFPTHGPCATTGRCEVLGSITPERVIREVEKKLEHYAGR
jgi:ADP-heptose:LPS heptosyltransferase